MTRGTGIPSPAVLGEAKTLQLRRFALSNKGDLTRDNAVDDHGNTGRRSGRPTKDQAEQLARSILDAALDEFLRCGLEGASIERIAAAADVARTAVYRRFGSKRSLFVRVLERQVRLLRDIGDGIIQNAADPLDRLKGTAFAYCRVVATPASLQLNRIMLWAAAILDADGADLNMIGEELDLHLETLIIQAQDHGYLGKTPARDLRKALTRLVAEGLRWKALMAARALSDEEITEDFEQFWHLFLQLAENHRRDT